MIKKIFLIKIVISFLINMIFAENSRINGLEKRIDYLENRVEELEQKISKYSPNLFEELTKGVSKSKIKSSFGNPDRKGKFSNGDELWGFRNYTLKFDKNGKLKNWSKPFVN
tara:strand:- start:65 stop:400 length:336 start_codon:yes stop_codon:yes gene_type:complete